MNRRRSETSFLPQRPAPPAAPKQTVSALLHEFLRDFRSEPDFERSILSSPSLRNFLLRVSPVMERDAKTEVLKMILFGGDYEHAFRAAKILARVRQAWAFKLLDAALTSSQPQTRYAALRGSTGCNASFPAKAS